MADLVVGETTCDGKKKMYELMAETRPMYVLELPQKRRRSRRPASTGYAELKKFRAFLEDRFHDRDHRLPSSARRSRVMNRERALAARAGRADAGRPPAADGPRNCCAARAASPAIPADLAQYEKALACLSPANRRVSGDAAPVRVLMTGVPMVHGAERVLEIVEQAAAWWWPWRTAPA